MSMVIYEHKSGVIGTLDKTYRATGDVYYTIMVKTFTGRKFYAPEHEWIKREVLV